MSIHPEFAEALMNGSKRVEFRRVVPKSKVSHVIVYATQPVGRVVGALELGGADTATPSELWSKYQHVGGIPRDDFFRYFEGRETGTALIVRRVLRCREPFPLGAPLFPTRPPQSFMYLEPEALERLNSPDVSERPGQHERRRRARSSIAPGPLTAVA